MTVVQRNDRLLPREPPALGEAVADALRADGVELRLRRSPTAGTERSMSWSSPTAAVPRVGSCDPQAAAVGAITGEFVATVPLAKVPRTATYTRAYDPPGLPDPAVGRQPPHRHLRRRNGGR